MKTILINIPSEAHKSWKSYGVASKIKELLGRQGLVITSISCSLDETNLTSSVFCRFFFLIGKYSFFVPTRTWT